MLSQILINGQEPLEVLEKCCEVYLTPANTVRGCNLSAAHWTLGKTRSFSLEERSGNSSTSNTNCSNGSTKQSSRNRIRCFGERGVADVVEICTCISMSAV